MTHSCQWLPDLVLLETYGGDWSNYIAAVYQHFKKNFIDSRPTFEGKNVGFQREPLFQEKEYTFWHCTSEGEEEEEKRTPDIRRCERIRWPRPIIEHSTDTKVRCWRNKRKSEKRVLFWFYQEDYVVIIAERKNYFLLRTAYLVTFSSYREKLLKEYEEYSKKTDAAS